MSGIGNKDIAREAREAVWVPDEGRRGWLRPEREVIEVAKRLFAKGSRAAIDVACGVGRHALELAEIGFAVSATDLSDAALNQLRAEAGVRALDIDVTLASMTALPYLDHSFDYALAYNVSCHGDGSSARAAIAEARRVLRKGGILQATMLSTRSTTRQSGGKIAAGPFGGGDDNRDHAPGIFCDTDTLKEFLSGFEWLQVEDRPRGESEYRYWHIVVERA